MDVLTESFARFFQGNPNAHGCYIPSGEVDAKGKSKGKASTVKEQVQAQHYQDHLEGKVGLGIAPIRPDGTVYFAAIDVDDYGTDLQSYVSLCWEKELPLLPFRSKSGGLHLYMFFGEPEPASQVIDLCKELLAVLGLPRKTEIFPKQDKLAPKDVGNWINLPYFNQGERAYLQDQHGNRVELAQALYHMQERRTSLREVRAFVESLPCHDGPPCLEHILLKGDTDNRNTFMFSVGVYCQARFGEEFEQHLQELNRSMKDPLDETEIHQTIVKSLHRSTYSYKCKEHPLNSCCHNEICKTRAFGIAGKNIPGLDLGQMTKIETNPPHYEWIVNGQVLTFASELDMLKQERFRVLVLRNWGIVLPTLKNTTWEDILKKAHATRDVRQAPTDTLAQGEILLNQVRDLLTGRMMATTLDKVAFGLVYPDSDKQELLFRPADILKEVQKHNPKVTGHELREVLDELGYREVSEHLDPESKGRPHKLARIPWASAGYQPPACDAEPVQHNFDDYHQSSNEPGETKQVEEWE